MPEPNWKEMIDNLPSVKLEKAEKRIRKLESAIVTIQHTLMIPAAEYVPAIGDVFQIIDRLKVPGASRPRPANK